MGGKGLYSAELFMNHEIKLNILETKELNYNQFSSEFVPWLSMIDVMMFNKSSSTKDMLSKYKLTK